MGFCCDDSKAEVVLWPVLNMTSDSVSIQGSWKCKHVKDDEGVKATEHKNVASVEQKQDDTYP